MLSGAASCQERMNSSTAIGCREELSSLEQKYWQTYISGPEDVVQSHIKHLPKVAHLDLIQGPEASTIDFHRGSIPGGTVIDTGSIDPPSKDQQAVPHEGGLHSGACEFCTQLLGRDGTEGMTGLLAAGGAEGGQRGG